MNDVLLCSLLWENRKATEATDMNNISYIKYILLHAYSIRAANYNDKWKKRIKLFTEIMWLLIYI